MSNLQIKFAQIDPAAKADISSIIAPDKISWSNINDLIYDNMPKPGNYATMEHNYTILDGGMEEFPDETDGETWGLWSDSLSDEAGNFANPPALDISFHANHKSRGLTLYFYPFTDDYAKEICVTWYDSRDEVIKTGIYALNSNIGVISEPVIDFRRIAVEFLSTNIRHRFIKLYALEYGVIRILPDEEIDSCRILEEIDPTVESISINILNATDRKSVV